MGAGRDAFVTVPGSARRPEQLRRYRWAILAGGCVAQASVSAILLGLPAIAPAIRSHYGLSLTQVGVVLAAQNFGGIVTLLPWGMLADRVVERVGSVGDTLREARVWRLCAGSTFYVATQIALMSFLVLFLHDHRGVATGTAAGALALAQVLGGAIRIGAGRWSDHLRARVVPLRTIGLAIAFGAAITALLVDAPLALLVPVLVVATTLALSWNGLSFTAAAEAAGEGRSGAAIGLQQTFLAGGSIVAPIAFGAVVHAASWRTAFIAAALSPLVGWTLLAPLAER